MARAVGSAVSAPHGRVSPRFCIRCPEPFVLGVDGAYVCCLCVVIGKPPPPPATFIIDLSRHQGGKEQRPVAVPAVAITPDSH